MQTADCRPIQTEHVVAICVFKQLGPVVQWINLDPVDKAIGFPKTYPLDNDLSVGYHYLMSEQPWPGHLTIGTLSNLDDELSGRQPEVFSRSPQLLRMSVMSSSWRSGRDIC